MRPPLRAIEPARAGVSMLTRGERAMATSRDTTPPVPPDALGRVPGTGLAGPPSFGLGLGTPSGPAACVAALFCRAA